MDLMLDLPQLLGTPAVELPNMLWVVPIHIRPLLVEIKGFVVFTPRSSQIDNEFGWCDLALDRWRSVDIGVKAIDRPILRR